MINKFTNPDLMDEIIAQTEAGIAALAASVASEAASMAPVAYINGGRLRDSIVWKTSKQGSGDVQGVPEPKELEGYVGSALDYAVYQEFGTRYMRPQPYLRPAIAIKALGRNGADIMIRKINETARGKLTPENIDYREQFGLR